MPKLRRMSGKEVVSVLVKDGFLKLRQRGSHIRLVLKNEDALHYVTVPLHTELDSGTLKSIIRSLERCMTGERIKELFY